MILLVATAACASDDVLTFHPAHWVDGDEVQPTFYISPLDAVCFPSPKEGWIVGERYVLHIQGEKLEVAFVELREARNSVSFSNPQLGWASSALPDPWPMLRYRSGTWSGEPMTGIGWADWGIAHVVAGPTGDAWAFASFSQKVPGKRIPALLHYDGVRWAVDETLLAEHAGWHPFNACQSPDGTWWFVGIDESAPSGWEMLLARRDGSNLQRISERADRGWRSGLFRIRCLSDGTIWASGSLRPAKDQPAEILLMRFTAGAWERVPVTADGSHEWQARALAPVSAGETWLSVACDSGGAECCERFLHYRDGEWETVGLPFMPGGRCRKVFITDAQFVSPDEGWAVGTDMEPRLGGGRIFHYKDGRWRLRNWNWHFWDAPWFNLFG